MVRHTLKILQQMLQDFQSVPDHFQTLCIIQGRRSGVFNVNFEHISQLFLVFLLLTLNK